MQAITTGQRDTFTKSGILKCSMSAIMDWNINRCVKILSVTNPTVTTPEDLLFPVSSVVEPNRPLAGIVKGQTGTSSTAVGKVNQQISTSNIHNRTFTVSTSDVYKYWASPNKSGTALYNSTAGQYAISGAVIEIAYEKAIKVNKFSITFENTFVAPKNFTVEFKINGAWAESTTINNPTLTRGVFKMYRGSSAWSTTVDRANPVAISGVRVTINAVSKQNSYAYVIEVAPSREEDLSDFVDNVSYNDTISESDALLPVGKISSNTADLTLSNYDGRFDKSGAEFSDYIFSAGRFDLKFNIHKPTAAPAASEWLQATTRTVDKPNVKPEEVSISLKDSSFILQNAKPLAMMLEDVSPAEVAVVLCQSVGFNNFSFTPDNAITAEDSNGRIPYYWVDPEKTVWDSLSEIAENTQTAFYFDEFDRLSFKTRSEILNIGASLSWIFDTDDVTDLTDRPAADLGKFADVQEAPALEFVPGPNLVKVNYSPTALIPPVNGMPVMDAVWEPEDTVTLRASSVYSDLPAPTGSWQWIYIKAADAAYWPYTGMLQIESEIIEYDAKHYGYYDANNVYQRKYIKSNDEKDALDALNPNSWRNAFTGALRIQPSGRGAMNTVASSHLRYSANYAVRSKTGSAAMKSATSRLQIYPGANYAILSSVGMSGTATNTYLVARRSLVTNDVPKLYGTSVRFGSVGTYGAAGICFGLGGSDSGIYVELLRTDTASKTSGLGELSVSWKNSSGTVTKYSGKGVPLLVANDIDYDIDVAVESGGSNHSVTVFVNGAARLTANIPKSSSVTTLPSAVGMFTRGKTSVRFDYLYAGEAGQDAFDESSYLDLITGSFRSAKYPQAVAKLASNGWGYKSRDRTSTIFNKKIFTLDEFGLIAHEVRKFSVKFENVPAYSQSLYMSNDTQATCTDFMASPFGASFTLVNTSRQNAVINGDDTLTFGPDNSIDQKLIVYGQMVNVAEAKTEETKDARAIVKDGRSEMTFEGNLVQTQSQAKRLADWLVDVSQSVSVDVQAFNGAFLQLTDRVAINDPRNGLNWKDIKFFVVGKQVSFDGSLSVDFALRGVV